MLCRAVSCSKETVLQHFTDLGMKEITPKCVAKLLGEEGGWTGSGVVAGYSEPHPCPTPALPLPRPCSIPPSALPCPLQG